MSQLTFEMIQKLRDLAAMQTYTECGAEDDVFNPYDMWGGNADDCYWGGTKDGAITLAREVLAALGK